MKNSVLNRNGRNLKRLFTILTNTVLLPVLIISCSSLHGRKTLTSDLHPVPVTWFNADTGHYLFNTSIDLMKKHFSGITIIKPMQDGNNRVIMITETGLKILDMEFFPDSASEIHYIMEPLNKKMLIRVLSRDLSMILANSVDNTKFLYVLEPANNHPVTAMFTKRRRIKAGVNFYGNNNSGLDSIKLAHKNIDLSIRLYRIYE